MIGMMNFEAPEFCSSGCHAGRWREWEGQVEDRGFLKARNDEAPFYVRSFRRKYFSWRTDDVICPCPGTMREEGGPGDRDVSSSLIQEGVEGPLQRFERTVIRNTTRIKVCEQQCLLTSKWLFSLINKWKETRPQNERLLAHVAWVSLG